MHDPTLTGWIVTVLFAVAGMGATLVRGRSIPVHAVWFWRLCGAALLLLALNKQLDLQSLLVTTGRNAVESLGLARFKSAIQWAMLLCVGGVMVGAGIAMLWLAARARSEPLRWLLIAAFALEAAYIGVRATDILKVHELPPAAYAWIEVAAAGIAVSAAGARLSQQSRTPGSVQT